MKRFLLPIALFSLVAVIGFTACSKDDVTDVTSSVTGTMSAEVDGSSWSSVGPAAVFSNGGIAITGLADNDRSIVVTSGDDITGTYSFSPLTPQGTGLYRIKTSDTTNLDYIAFKGSMVITEIKTSNKRISGTFSYEAYNISTSDTVKITAGTFTNINYTEQ